jgi:hypothetical protein
MLGRFSKYFLFFISIFCNVVFAYRPVQFVKHTGDVSPIPRN